MKIAIFNWRCFRHPQAGGSELYLYEQAKVWAVQGHEILWFTARPAGAEREERKDGIRFIRSGGMFSVYPMAAINFYRHGKADMIIDVENGIPFFSPLFTRVPCVLLIHHIHTEVWSRETSGITARIGPLLESRAMPAVYRKIPIITVSESSAGMIADLFGRYASIDIVHNAISSELTPGTKAAEPEIIYLGRLRRYKSVDVLLNALSLLGDKAPLLHLVGQGEDEKRLREMAAQRGLRTVFHGFVHDAEKRRLLQRAWIAVNPSSMEGWGITNIEANACGVPVLGSDVPGIRDSISPGVSGELFPYGRADLLAGKLAEWLDDLAYLQQLSASSREWAEQFSWENSANLLMALLEKNARLKKDQNL